MSSISSETLGFPARMSTLEAKLKQSEDERLSLEEKFNQLLRTNKSNDTMSMRLDYCVLLDQDRMRCDRNDHILRMLSQVESRASALTAKTDRLRLLRRHYETFLNRNYPSWKRGTPSQSNSKVCDQSSQPLASNLSRPSASPLSRFAPSPSITRRSSLVVPESELLEYSKYKFASETNIASPSLRKRLFIDSSKRRDTFDSDTILPRARSYTDVFRESPMNSPRLNKDEQNTSNDLLAMSLSEDNLSQYLPNEKENDFLTYKPSISNNNYKSSFILEKANRSPSPSKPVRTAVPKPSSSYKPLTRSSSLYAAPSYASKPPSVLPSERRSVLTRRPSVVYQTSVSVQSESSFPSPSSSRITSPRASRSVSPRSDYTKSKQNPLQVVDDIFKKYLINYDQRYLCDPISESKYGKYLYPPGHREYHLEECRMHSPTYSPTARVAEYNLHPESHSYLPPRDGITYNRLNSYGSNESLYDRKYKSNSYDVADSPVYSNINDWKDWSYYRDRYEYSPELDFKDSQSKLNYGHGSRSSYKPYSMGDFKEPSSYSFLDSMTSRFPEPSNSSARHATKSSAIPSIVEEPLLTARNPSEKTEKYVESKFSPFYDPEEDTRFKGSLKPPPTPKKVSFSNNNIDYEQTDSEETLSIDKDLKHLINDKLSSDKKESDDYNYKPYDFQNTNVDTHNVDADKFKSKEMKTYKFSTEGQADQDSYDTPFEGKDHDWKTGLGFYKESLSCESLDVPNMKDDKVRTQGEMFSSDKTPTKFDREDIVKEKDFETPNLTENSKSATVTSDRLSEKYDDKSKVSVPYKGIYDNFEGIQAHKAPTNKQNKFHDQNIEKEFTDEAIKDVLKRNDLVEGSEPIHYESNLNEQISNKYDETQHQLKNDVNQYPEGESNQNQLSSYDTYTGKSDMQDEYTNQQYIEDPTQYAGDQIDGQYDKSQIQYNEQVGSEYQQQPVAEYKSTQEPYIASEYQQQPAAAYESTQEPYVTSEYQQQPVAEYESTQQPYVTSEYQQQPVAEYESTQEPYVASEYQQQPVAEYESTQEPYVASEYQQQPVAEYESTQEPYVTTEYQQQPVSDYEPTQEPHVATEYQQQPTAEYESTQEPYSAEQYGQGNIPKEYQQSEVYEGQYGSEYQQSADYDADSHRQQSAQQPVGYEDKTYRQPRVQEQPSAGFEDNNYKQQNAQDPQPLGYEDNNYPPDQQQPEEYQEYKQQNIQDDQPGYQDDQYLQDHHQPTGYDPQAGYEQSVQDIQQAPTEQYQDENYVQQDQYPQDYIRGSKEYLPDQYPTQPSRQEYSQPQYEGEYPADYAQKPQYQEGYEDQTQGQTQKQYEADYNNSAYQNDPQYQYQQDNMTYDQTNQNQYQYDQQPQEQYQQQYQGTDQYGNNNYDYGYDNQGQGQQVYGGESQQPYTQDTQAYDNADTVYSDNVQQPYQEMPQQAVSGENEQAYNAQYTEGSGLEHVDQTQLDSSRIDQDAVGYAATPQPTVAPASSEAAPDLSRVLESDSESGPMQAAAPHDDSSDFDFSSAAK